MLAMIIPAVPSTETVYYIYEAGSFGKRLGLVFLSYPFLEPLSLSNNSQAQSVGLELFSAGSGLIRQREGIIRAQIVGLTFRIICLYQG